MRREAISERLPGTVHKVIAAGYRILVSCHRCGYEAEVTESALAERDQMFGYHRWPCPTCERPTARASLIPPPRELTEEQNERKAELEKELARANTIGETARLHAALAPLRADYVPDQEKVFRETVRDNEQNLAKLIGRTGYKNDLALDAQLTLSAEILGMIIAYARSGDEARWNRLNSVPELSSREILEDALALGLTLKIQTSELLAMAGKRPEQSERARFAAAKKLAEYLDDRFVFAQKMRRGR